MALLLTISYVFLRGVGAGGIFIPHPRKQCQDYLIDLKFDTRIITGTRDRSVFMAGVSEEYEGPYRFLDLLRGTEMKFIINQGGGGGATVTI